MDFGAIQSILFKSAEGLYGMYSNWSENKRKEEERSRQEARKASNEEFLQNRPTNEINININLGDNLIRNNQTRKLVRPIIFLEEEEEKLYRDMISITTNERNRR